MAAKKVTASGTGTTTSKTGGGAEDSLGNQGNPNSRSAAIAREGIRTGDDFANLMSALMSDVIEGSLTPIVANATVNAGGKLLKVVEMQYKYGSPKTSAPLTLTLAPGK
jgi:hypothetical protein